MKAKPPSSLKPSFSPRDVAMLATPVPPSSHKTKVPGSSSYFVSKQQGYRYSEGP
ncbi:hypothetical protein J6590_072837 [Homalodisca vitripennis]|nr:hypothetical protein J6590_072837 [Homalodisca vitripennis]